MPASSLNSLITRLLLRAYVAAAVVLVTPGDHGPEAGLGGVCILVSPPGLLVQATCSATSR